MPPEPEGRGHCGTSVCLCLRNPRTHVLVTGLVTLPLPAAGTPREERSNGPPEDPELGVFGGGCRWLSTMSTLTSLHPTIQPWTENPEI